LWGGLREGSGGRGKKKFVIKKDMKETVKKEQVRGGGQENDVKRTRSKNGRRKERDKGEITGKNI